MVQIGRYGQPMHRAWLFAQLQNELSTALPLWSRSWDQALITFWRNTIQGAYLVPACARIVPDTNPGLLQNGSIKKYS